jgi:cell division protein FtsB
MRQAIFLFFLLLTSTNSAFANISAEAILDSLDQTIARKQEYEQQKEKELSLLKEWLREATTQREEFDLSTRLYEAYRKYQIDSAIVYAQKALKNAKTPENVQHTHLQLVILYSSTGMFREAETILQRLNKNELPKSLLADYYNAWRLFFNYYAANVQLPEYDQKTRTYRDSLIQVLNPESMFFRINQAESLIEKGETQPAGQLLTNMLGEINPENENYAMVTFLKGLLHEIREETEKSQRFFALSAINDIRKSTKDNSSIQHLAALAYEQGNIERAFQYSQVALNDALFCNVQFRTYYLTQFFTFINANYKEKIEKQKNQLLLFLFLISLLSLFLIGAVIYVYKQKDKVSGIRRELDEMNKELLRLNNNIKEKNNQLNERNTLLQDANQIKEEYIAHFFDLCSSYINKLEDYRKSLNKKAVNGEHEKLFKMLKSTSIIETEVEELYRNFDTIFLNLYPTFVEEFNQLLTDEEKSEPKNGEKLNTELRIFALVRLGITDSVKIASFLRYSLSTIYNYRTKARNRSAVPREKFEEMVMKIGTLRKPNQ